MTAKNLTQNERITWHKNPVIAHRGAWKANGLPENSIAALKQAINLNCYGSEFDVHLTQDSLVVVNHDDDFLGMPISTSTYQQLLEKKLPNGEQIPRLADYLKEGLKQKGTKLILEVKQQNSGWERDELLSRCILAEVSRFEAQAWIEYISFGYDICQFLVKSEPNAIVFYLGGDVSPEQLKADGLKGADYHYSVFEKNPTWLSALKKIGLSSNAWTVNKGEDMDRLLAQNINYLTTNEPELVFERMKRR